MTRAIVVGASMAGLVAARVLADVVDEVEVLERDAIDLDHDVTPRRGVPQGRHAHAILAAGEQALERWFPGLVDDLVAAGAVRGDNGDARWYQAGAERVRAVTGIEATSMSRPLLEGTVRRRLVALGNVSLRSGTSVEGLALDGPRVRGVRVAGAELAADLVVDCSGRNSRLLDDLVAAGFALPDESNVKMDMSYATRVLRRSPGDLDAMFGIVAPTPPRENRFGVLLPMEGDRWILTMGGFHGDTCPTDDDGFRAFARSLPAPFVSEVLDRAEPLSDVMTHRMASSRRRHFEKLSRVPDGFLALGDVVCSFNPIYGQGMSSAAQQATVLESCLRAHEVGTAACAGTFYRKAAKVVDNPWQITAGGDFLHPSTTGPKPPGTDLINRYIGRVMLASHTSPEVLTSLARVANLLDPPPALMKPATMWRVLRAARRSPAAAGAPAREAAAPPSTGSPDVLRGAARS